MTDTNQALSGLAALTLPKDRGLGSEMRLLDVCFSGLTLCAWIEFFGPWFPTHSHRVNGSKGGSYLQHQLVEAGLLLGRRMVCSRNQHYWG